MTKLTLILLAAGALALFLFVVHTLDQIAMFRRNLEGLKRDIRMEGDLRATDFRYMRRQVEMTAVRIEGNAEHFDTQVEKISNRLDEAIQAGDTEIKQVLRELGKLRGYIGRVDQGCMSYTADLDTRLFGRVDENGLEAGGEIREMRDYLLQVAEAAAKANVRRRDAIELLEKRFEHLAGGAKEPKLGEMLYGKGFTDGQAECEDDVNSLAKLSGLAALKAKMAEYERDALSLNGLAG